MFPTFLLPVPMMHFRHIAAITAALTLSSSPATAQTALFNFENAGANVVAPLSLTNSGITATFTGEGVGVCDVEPLNFAGLSGLALIQGYCIPASFGALEIVFSSQISSLQFNFAMASVGDAALTFDAFLGNASAGSVNALAVLPPGLDFVEGAILFAGDFDRVILTSADNIAFGIDNLSATAVPEPSTFALLCSGFALLGAAVRRRPNNT